MAITNGTWKWHESFPSHPGSRMHGHGEEEEKQDKPGIHMLKIMNLHGRVLKDPLRRNLPCEQDCLGLHVIIKQSQVVSPPWSGSLSFEL